MKIAILGGGLTGLTASYYLAKKNHQVTIFEKNSSLGGLAAGFKSPGWDWYLDYAYHHLFANDFEIISFAKEIGFNKIFFQSPKTDSIFDDLKIYPMDNPIDFLRLPYLDIFDKLRAGMVLAFLKVSPFLKIYEEYTAGDFLKKTMGDNVWRRLWQELFRKKFGDYAGIILASFFWARIKKRTKNLGYIEGGFQTFVNYLENRLESLKVKIFKGCQIQKITKKEGKYYLVCHSREGENLVLDRIKEDFDIVVSTLPTPIMVKLTEDIFPAKLTQKFRKIKYLSALTLILESKKPLLKKTYWLNVLAKKIPIMGIVQHTNFIDKKYYGENHLCYLGWYLKEDDKKLKMTKEELLKYVLSYLKKINPQFPSSILNTYLFKASYAQPIFDKFFLKNKPNFITPLENFYIANLDMTYPYDRGTNYAVKLGKEVSQILI